VASEASVRAKNQETRVAGDRSWGQIGEQRREGRTLSGQEKRLSAHLTDARAGDPFQAASPCLDLSPTQVRVLPGAR
jgi:hypothetical protein